MNTAPSQAQRSQQDSYRLQNIFVCVTVLWRKDRTSARGLPNRSKVQFQRQLQLPRRIQQIAAGGQLAERIALQPGAARPEAMPVKHVEAFGAELHPYRFV